MRISDWSSDVCSSDLDIALAACAYKFDVGATVRARAIVEPWVISIAAAGFWFVSARDGLMLSYAAAMVGAFLTALVPMIRHYGGPGVWRPHPAHLILLARRNAPLAAADAIEWGTRRLDLFILGQFTSRSEEHTSELQSLMRLSYAVFFLKKKRD